MNGFIQIFCVLIVLGCTLGAESKGTPKHKQDETDKVESLLWKLADALSNHDYSDLNRFYYTDDCQLLAPGGPITACKKEVEEDFKDFPFGVFYELLPPLDNQQLADDVIVSTVTLYIVRKATNERRMAKYVLVWKRVNGEWLIFRDIFNYND